MLPGCLIVLVFLVLAGLMMSRRLPALLALPVMAVAIGLISGVAGGVPHDGLRDLIFKTILTDGAGRLSTAMMYAVFGAILSQVVMRQGIAARIVRLAAEYAGDRKMVLAFFMTAAIAVAFASLTGLGAVIMIGSLALPILIGAGLSPGFSACLMLFGICIGGAFNLANMGLYIDVLKVDLGTVKQFATSYGTLLALAAAAFMALEARQERRRLAWAVDVGVGPQPIPTIALLTPLVPIGLIMMPWPLNLVFQSWPIIPAFVVGMLFGLLTTEPGRLVNNLTAAVLEGLKDVAPVLGLFIGIGMVLNAMMDPSTARIMAPFITHVIPTTKLGFVLFFTLLAPLGLYRGPLNFIGLGAGFAGLVLANNLMPPAAVMAAFLGVGQVQGVCDPTNTSNVWLAQFTHTSTEDFLKRTLPFVWVFVLVALVYAVVVVGVM
ncbi:MAG TPA: transporter [Candidatus Xenobia bacterium]|jgi:H+/gluconate symporter-like permease